MPYDQLGQLLGWDASQFEFMLKEDDGLWIKFGKLKPRCARVTHRAPDAASKAAAAKIRATLREELGDRLAAPAEPPFAFIRRLSSSKAENEPSRSPPLSAPQARFSLRMLYPYLLRYGDPLMGSSVDEDISDGYLSELAATGVNAIARHKYSPENS